MISAEAKKINYDHFSTVQTRKIKRKCINKEQVVRWLVISGIFISLMAVNAIVQALLAQTQMKLNDLQTKIEALDREIGERRLELANLSSYERVEGLASTKLGMKLAGTDNISIALLPSKQSQPEELEIPLYMVKASHPQDNGVRARTYNMPEVVDKIGHWIAGLGRTLAGFELKY